MLERLRVKNYALIRSLDVELHNGLSIITGETGAGKSILLGALSLILGQRADTFVLKDKEKKCMVEGLFNVEGYGLEEVFNEHDLDYENSTVLRREIGVSGKSRAFVNDTPVSLKVMREVGLRLVDIHSQHQNLELKNRQFQLLVVDLYADNSELLSKYRKVFEEYKGLREKLSILEGEAERSGNDYDYYAFQYEQLKNASLSNEEQPELEAELELLNNAEEVKRNLSNAVSLLNSDSNSLIGKVKEGVGLLSKADKYLPEDKRLLQRFESVYLELKDISDEAEAICDSVEFNAERLVFVNERLDLIYMLQQKHKVDSIEELNKLKADFEEKILSVTSYEEQLKKLKEEVSSKQDELYEYASLLHDKRVSVVPEIEDRVNRLLTQFGMPSARYKVEIIKEEVANSSGMDAVNFLFSANRDSSLCEISKVASGGEMSRLMLSVKSLVAKSKALPTIIFDEIDSGISGEIAGKMGSILKEMSGGMQVINITHLPQVAAKGDYHFCVYKKESETETITNIKMLSDEERVEELAKMLSGESISNAAIQNAESLLR